MAEINNTKVKVVYRGKEEFNHIFEHVLKAEKYICRIAKNKPFLKSLEEGMIGEAEINFGETNWVNEWKHTPAQEKVPTKEEYKEEDIVNQVQDSVMLSNVNGARDGMLINNAVQIAIAEFNKSDSKHLDVNRVVGLYKVLNTSFKENK